MSSLPVVSFDLFFATPVLKIFLGSASDFLVKFFWRWYKLPTVGLYLSASFWYHFGLGGSISFSETVSSTLSSSATINFFHTTIILIWGADHITFFTCFVDLIGLLQFLLIIIQSLGDSFYLFTFFFAILLETVITIIILRIIFVLFVFLGRADVY